MYVCMYVCMHVCDMYVLAFTFRLFISCIINIYIHIYIYIYVCICICSPPPFPPPPKIYAHAFVDHGAWGARNTVMLKKFQNF